MIYTESELEHRHNDYGRLSPGMKTGLKTSDKMRTLFFIFPSLVFGTYYIVPQQAGPYGVSIESLILTDHSLPDPYLDIPYRRIAASIIASTGAANDCIPILEPYMPLPTAQFWEQAVPELIPLNFNDTLSETTLQLCKPIARNTSQPLIVFAPGAGIARQLYHLLMNSLVAQTGYTVITYEQPGYFPDEFVELAQRNFTFGGPIKTLVEDAMFIIDSFNYSQATIWGHSEGGGVAAGTLTHDNGDSPLLGGINLDGGFYSNYTLLNYTTSKPFAFFSRTGQDQPNALTPWSTAWENLHGDKWQVQLNESTHYSFSDAPYLVRDLYNLTDGANETMVAEAIGSIPGEIAMEVIPAMGAAFFNFVFGKADASSVVRRARELGWFVVQNVTIVD